MKQSPRLFEQYPTIAKGEIVENERLGAALATIQATHEQRDVERLLSAKVTLRDKAHIVGARLQPNLPPTPRVSDSSSPPAAVAAYLARFAEEQRLKRKAANRAAAERLRERQASRDRDAGRAFMTGRWGTLCR